MANLPFTDMGSFNAVMASDNGQRAQGTYARTPLKTTGAASRMSNFAGGAAPSSSKVAGASHVGCCGTNTRQPGCSTSQPENVAGTRSTLNAVRQPQE